MVELQVDSEASVTSLLCDYRINSRACVPSELFSRLQHVFTDATLEIERAAQYLVRKMLIASGIFLAVCASASYLFLHDKKNLVRIEQSITEWLGFLEEPYC